jgi:hypothetical protein
MWFLGKRETVNAWKKATLTDSEIKRNRSEVSSKWNKCRIYGISWTVAVGWSELAEVVDYC